MWSYYGSKSKLVKYYPTPRFNKIIEPFAGSARYSLQHWENDVLLVDKSEEVIATWNYLKKCSISDIMGLPTLKQGMLINELSVSLEEKIFLGYMAGIASSRPRNKVSSFASIQFARGNKLKKVADNLHKIKHWVIQLGDYLNIPNQTATWFIDGPYEFGGLYYQHNLINYNQLGGWSKSRLGQRIICENQKATWLDFIPLKNLKGANNKQLIEVVNYN